MISRCNPNTRLLWSKLGVPSQVRWAKQHPRLSCSPSVVKSTSRNANNLDGRVQSTRQPVFMRTRSGSHPEVKPPRSIHKVRAIFLVGFMGAGKTTVGQALALQLGWPFEDLDDRIQAREKRTIEQIFRESGEAEFRRAEH